MRSGIDSPLLINRTLREKVKINKISVGGSFVLALSDNGKVFGVGENYKVMFM